MFGVPSRWCVCSLAGKRVLSLIGRWILCLVVCPFARFWGLASLGRFTKYKSSLCSKPCLMADTSISIHFNSLCHFSCFPYWTYKGVYNILCCIFVLLSWTGPLTLFSPTSLFKMCLCPTSRGTGHVKNYLFLYFELCCRRQLSYLKTIDCFTMYIMTRGHRHYSIWWTMYQLR